MKIFIYGLLMDLTLIRMGGEFTILVRLLEVKKCSVF